VKGAGVDSKAAVDSAQVSESPKAEGRREQAAYDREWGFGSLPPGRGTESGRLRETDSRTRFGQRTRRKGGRLGRAAAKGRRCYF
jgi:hypothetical protein